MVPSRACICSRPTWHAVSSRFGTTTTADPCPSSLLIKATVLRAVCCPSPVSTAPIRCRRCGTGEEFVRSARFLSNWLYVYFPIVMGLLKTASGSLPPRRDFCGSFWNGFDGFAVASTRGGRQTEEGGARDRSGGGRCEVADFSIGLLSVWPRRLRKSLALDTKQWIWPG